MKRKNYKAVSSSLRRIANLVLTQDDLAKKIIIQKGNKYQVYGDYHLEETVSGWEISSEKLNSPLIFNTAKVALAWCILYQVGDIATAHHMEWLDIRVSSKQMDIDILSNRIETQEPLVDRAILLARLTEDINTRQKYKKELSKCVESAKYIKQKGTNNATNRFNKTSRRKHSR